PVFSTVRCRPHRFHARKDSSQRQGIITDSNDATSFRTDTHGVVNYFGSGIVEGLALWLGASLAFVSVHAVLWTSLPGRGRTVRYAAAAVLMSVPPFGIVGWAHPITAAGIVFPGWGWWGLAAAAIGLLAMTTK